MTVPLKIRQDRTSAVLRKEAKVETDARVARRDAGDRQCAGRHEPEAAARAAGMDRQTLRDWVLRYNEFGLDGLADQSREGRPPKLEHTRRHNSSRSCSRVPIRRRAASRPTRATTSLRSARNGSASG